MSSRVRIYEYPYGFRIQELVTTNGLYIEWDGLYRSKDDAIEFLKKMRVDYEIE